MPGNSKLTLFTSGYDGWGSSTDEFVRAADCIEKEQGFAPPFFVDLRLRRSGRAAGFVGSNFEKLVEGRHLWMEDLGNRAIAEDTAKRISIKRPAAANDLLNEVKNQALQNRRVIAFCSCAYDRWDCHRHAVRKLVIGYAEKASTRIEVIEWPGGSPQKVHTEVRDVVAISQRSSLHLGEGFPSVKFLSLPWGSVMQLQDSETRKDVVVGPAQRTKRGWTLPFLKWRGRARTPFVKAEESDAWRKRNKMIAYLSKGSFS